MGKRRKARELALQFLYQLDLRDEDDPEAHAAEFWARHPVDRATREFAETLVRGVKREQARTDELISRYAEHWELDRMAVVDRNILRMALWELLWGQDVPAKVVINEAIELAKKFGTEDSGRFVNGLLDRIWKEVRPAS